MQLETFAPRSQTYLTQLMFSQHGIYLMIPQNSQASDVIYISYTI